MSSFMENIVYPEQFKTQYIYVYKQFNGELKELIEKSGYKQEFTRKYRKALKFLEALKQECTKQKTFEKLIDTEQLYSIRLIGKKNIRIIFTFISFSSKEIAVLLWCFQEKDANNNSKTSYNNAIENSFKRKANIVK